MNGFGGGNATPGGAAAVSQLSAKREFIAQRHGRLPHAVPSEGHTDATSSVATDNMQRTYDRLHAMAVRGNHSAWPQWSTGEVLNTIEWPLKYSPPNQRIGSGLLEELRAVDRLGRELDRVVLHIFEILKRF